MPPAFSLDVGGNAKKQRQKVRNNKIEIIWKRKQKNRLAFNFTNSDSDSEQEAF
jgi:hypothetical protein